MKIFSTRDNKFSKNQKNFGKPLKIQLKDKTIIYIEPSFGSKHID
jgi:hypothetical protein